MNESGNTPRDANGATLHELATRLLTDPYRFEGDEPETPELFVGQLPEGLPLGIPIPEGATLVGSAVYGPPRGRRLYDVVIDAGFPAERFREVYRHRLLAAGWSEEDDPHPRRGFVPRGLPLFLRLASRFPRLRRRLRLDHQQIPPVFRLGARDPKLWLVVRDRRNAPAEARLRLLVGQRDPWHHHDDAWTVLPQLIAPPTAPGRPEFGNTNVLLPPPGARTAAGGSNESREPDGAYSYAVLETALDTSDLTAHYTAQLEGAGWTRTEGGESGPQSWSAWALTDEKGRPWAGTLTALSLSGPPNRYLLQIHAGRVPDE